jgi:hypothetical protein
VDPTEGLLILDDTTLEKPYANDIEHVTSGTGVASTATPSRASTC